MLFDRNGKQVSKVYARNDWSGETREVDENFFLLAVSHEKYVLINGNGQELKTITFKNNNVNIKSNDAGLYI